MAKITFSDENIKGDIPYFEITKDKLLDDYSNILHDLLKTRNGKIIVSFQEWEHESNYNLQFQDFLISNDDITTIQFMENHIEHIEDNKIDFNFFCFDTYEDAFKYCKDLKEGF